MKQIDPKENRIVFFTSMPLEDEPEIHDATIQAAHALALKKHNKVFVYTIKSNKTASSETLDDIRTALGKAVYRHYSIPQLLKHIPQAHQLIVDNKPLPLFLVSFLALSRKISRKRVLVQTLIPLYIENAKTFRDRIHNIRYTSPFYIALLYLAGKHRQVVNAQDKKRIHQASLIRTPSNDAFFKADKANRSIGRKRTVIISGALNYQKGTDMLPLLFKQLKKKNLLEQLRFIIIGEGDMRDIVEKIEKKYKNVKYIKIASTKRMIDMYTKGNIFLSLARHQPSLHPITEAMAMGLIPVVFRIPNLYSKRLKDVIHYVDAFEIKEIVKTLQQIAKEQEQQLKDESIKIEQFAARNYTIDAYIKKLENIFTN